MINNKISNKKGEDQDQNEPVIHTIEENKSVVIALSQKAHTSIDIFTQDMDTEIFNNSLFEQSIFSFARRHHKTLIRILAQDTNHAVQNGHCLIRLAQTLSSSVFIHKPAHIHKDKRINFMVIDRAGFIYRPASSKKSYNASFNYHLPQRAAALTDLFDSIWQQSTPDQQTRRIHI